MGGTAADAAGWTCRAYLRLEKVHHHLHVFHFEQALLAVQHNAQGHLHVAAGGLEAAGRLHLQNGCRAGVPACLNAGCQTCIGRLTPCRRVQPSLHLRWAAL